MNTQTLNSKIVFDIETDGLKPTKIWCIVAKVVDGSIHKFPPHKIEEGIKFLQDADVLIGHNIIGYDIPVIKKLCGVDLTNKVEDTLVMSRLFNPSQENGHSLKTWGYKIGLPKMPAPEFEEYSSEMLNYCVQDVKLNEYVYHRLLKDSALFSKNSIDLEHKVAAIIQQQRDNGFAFDDKAAMTLLANLQIRMEEVKEEVRQTFKPKWVDDKLVTPKFNKDGSLSKVPKLSDKEFIKVKENNYKPFMRKKLVEFNLGSRKQIGEYLKDFGWKPKRFTPTGQPIVDEGTLKKIKHIPEAQLIAEFLLLQKRIAQISSWINAVEGNRIHGAVISNGAITSRMTHHSPNTAQIPSLRQPYGKECRACWTVDEGNVLLGIDASGLELRMLAHYMQDEEFTNEILNGDVHSANQKLAGLKSRDIAKTFIYALMYGAGDARLGNVMNASAKAGKKARELFFENKPAFKKLRDKVTLAAGRTYLKALDGRILHIRNDHAALNTLLQGAGAIVMKKALVLFDKCLKEREFKYKFVANIHDEWQMEVPKDTADAIGAIGIDAIIAAGEAFKLRCPLDGEYKYGGNWSETH
jgi:DNA polymerase I-like protein with 3'-5' exonuclease and polymerase domains